MTREETREEFRKLIDELLDLLLADHAEGRHEHCGKWCKDGPE